MIGRAEYHASKIYMFLVLHSWQNIELLLLKENTIQNIQYHIDLSECVCVFNIFDKTIIEIKPGNLNDLQCHSSIPNFSSNIGLQFQMLFMYRK